MRIRPLVGEKLWFEPRGFGGWGWAPVTWQGWAVVGLVALGVLIPIPFLATSGGHPAYKIWVGLMITACLVVCVLKGTAPGGPSKRRRFLAEREKARHSKS